MHDFSFEELSDVEDLMRVMHPDEDLQGSQQRFPHSTLTHGKTHNVIEGGQADRLTASLALLLRKTNMKGSKECKKKIIITWYIYAFLIFKTQQAGRRILKKHLALQALH